MKDLAGSLPFLASFFARIPFCRGFMDTFMKADNFRRIPFNQELHLIGWMRHVALLAVREMYPYRDSPVR
jgi:hypothetical protein